MKNNFDLKKFLTENKLTSNSRAVNVSEDEIPFKKMYTASFDEIKEYLLSKLDPNLKGPVLDEVLKELFEDAENLADEQPGTSELDAVYAVSETLEDVYYEEEEDGKLAIAQAITKIIEPIA